MMALVAGARAYGMNRASSVGLVVGALCVPAIVYLDYIQLALIRAICSDCELAHVIGLFIVLYRSDRKAKES
jgi:uncharacterized membrane protein